MDPAAIITGLAVGSGVAIVGSLLQRRSERERRAADDQRERDRWAREDNRRWAIEVLNRATRLAGYCDQLRDAGRAMRMGYMGIDWRALWDKGWRTQTELRVIAPELANVSERAIKEAMKLADGALMATREPGFTPATIENRDQVEAESNLREAEFASALETLLAAASQYIRR